MQCVHIPTELPLCTPPLVVGTEHCRTYSAQRQNGSTNIWWRDMRRLPRQLCFGPLDPHVGGVQYCMDCAQRLLPLSTLCGASKFQCTVCWSGCSCCDEKWVVSDVNWVSFQGKSQDWSRVKHVCAVENSKQFTAIIMVYGIISNFDCEFISHSVLHQYRVHYHI